MTDANPPSGPKKSDSAIDSALAEPPVTHDAATPISVQPRCPSLLGRAILYSLALLFLFLGILGVFIPGMPTTVFILMSAWAAARSSPRLHQWLREHRIFGASLRNWEAGGFVSRKSKRTAVSVMSLSALIMIVFKVPVWATVVACTCMACVAIWLWRRPEPSESPSAAKDT